MSGYVVVDASLAFKWLVEEDDSDKADAILDDWSRRGIMLAEPNLMAFEVVNALHARVRRGELSVMQAAGLLESRISSVVELFNPPILHRRALELASDLGLGAAYDAHYLALAEHLDCEMWTADERFYRVASPAASRVRLLSEFVAPEL